MVNGLAAIPPQIASIVALIAKLFGVLAWRDLAMRYKQTVIGAGWAVIRLFITMLAFTVIFGRIAKLPSDGTTPYP
jgi:lipopolysaccharide transport system permease protein